jgi:two-component system OmpR family sensor kinase
VPIERDPVGLESELAALRAEVTRLREKERSSAQMIRELADAVAARDSFIAIAGHELRNPMGALLIGATNLAHRAAHTDEPLPSWLLPRLAGLERQARNFVRRATTLLDVSRITSGQLRLDPAEVDLSEIVLTVLEGFAVELERARSTLTMDVEEGVCGWWDRMAVDQVAYNLVSNAIKYGAGKPIHVSLKAERGRAVLVVADRGIGISKTDRARIFERFERAVTQTTHGGFGLGLWIVHELVQATGGLVRVESEPNVGSTFTVELPQTVPASEGLTR